MNHILLVLILCIACTQAPLTTRESDRKHDGFVGPVKKVFVGWSPISGSNYPAGSRCRQMTKVYDESGRVLQHSVYPGACGSDEMREDYTYAHDGSRMGKTQEIRGKDSPPPPPPIAPPPGFKEEIGEPRMVFKYDSSGRLIETASVKPSGKIMYKNTKSYDDKGRMIEGTGYDRDGQISDRRVYSYSSDDHVPSGVTYYGRDGKVYRRTGYTDYEFNSRGDWVKRKQTSELTFNRRSVSITFQEIKYYPDRK